ncbi:hypothetical protein, partial [Acholeplasma equifetale]|uniref:hypothetical protein n=1 Tax=Acholeplasma equifetale TaxID=264634 RepID=UPI00047B8C25
MKRIIIGSIVAVLSIFLLVGYSIFSVFDVTQGQLRRMELVITTASATKYYDGTPLSKPEWELKSGNLREGDTMFVTMSSSITDFGVVQNEIGVTIIDKDQINVTNNYVITYELGFLTINKRPLSIKTDSAYKVYDGTPLTRNFYEVTSGTIPEDHEMLVSMPTVLTEPGEVTNDIHITILNKDGVDVTKNFYMTYELGTLKMDSRPLFVETESLSKVYDGLELFGGYPILKNEILPNHYITIVKSTSIIEASSKTNETIVQITDEFGNDVSRFYDIQYNFGELRIDKRIIQLRTMSAEKPYDTTPLFAHGFDVLYGNLVLDHYFDIVYKNSITTPGSVDNEIDVKIMDGLGNYVTNNYSIEIEKGTLTIYKFTIFISTDSYQKYYDGISLEGGIPTVIGEFIEGHYYLITRRTEVIDAGYYDNVADITVFNEFGSDVTHYYDINYTYGTLTIYERPIRIRTKSASKAYDGLPLVAHEFELVEGTLVDGHSLNTSFIGLIIEPGIVDNEVVVQIIDYNNQYVTSNYLIEYDFGYLEVYRIQLTIVTESITKYYDGLPVNGGDPILMNELLPNHQFEVTYRTEVIDAGYYTNISNIRIYDENYRDVMHFYEINELFGSIVINQRPITIKTSSAEKSYDGLPLTSNQYEIISGDLIENHYLDVNFYQSITEPGFVMNSVIVNVKNMNGNIITNNYSISFIEGTLTVYKIPLTITTGDFSKVYDGLPLNGGSISLSGQLLPNHYFVETHRSNPVDAGDYLNEVTINIYDQDGKNVTNVYDITKELGQLSIYKRPITVKTLSAEKPYDGTPLYL